MLEHFLGRDLLKKGLRLYLQSHEFGNAETDDLWEALTKVTRKQGKVLDIKVNVLYLIVFLSFICNR